MRRFIAAAAVAALGFAGVANADFFLGQDVAINGTAGPEFGGTTWGTSAGQGFHQLGGQSTYFDAFFTAFTIEVSSSFLSDNVVSFVFDFSDFAPGDYSTHTIDILGLKDDGTISGVSASQGQFATNGNSVFWTGSGADLAANPVLKITVEQIPAPGALALVGLAGLAARRRRA